VSDNGGVSDQPETRPGTESVGTETVDTVSVRRAPRYYRFMAVGLVVGVIVSVVLTFSFPEQDDFTRFQVLGFTGLFIVAICVALAAVVALLVDRSSRRRARTIAAERVEEHESQPGSES
jgi:uncharacterized membrane protein YbhN (UPF0104 family)